MLGDERSRQFHLPETSKKEGLQPSPEADNQPWLRRVTLDLAGMLPTPGVSQAFAATLLTRRTRIWSTDCSARPTLATNGHASQRPNRRYLRPALRQ